VKTSPDTRTKVWLVDDSESVRELLPKLLGEDQRLSFPGIFSTPAQALGAIRAGALPDVVLLDVNIGTVQGLDYVRPLRLQAPGAKVLMISTFWNPGVQKRALAEGAAGYILKGSPVSEMLRVIHESEQPEVSPAISFAENNLCRREWGKNARSESAVRGFRFPAGHPLRKVWKLLTNSWNGATAYAARLGVNF